MTIGFAAAAAASVLFTQPALAGTCPYSPWKVISGTVSHSFLPQAVSCARGPGEHCTAAGYDVSTGTAVIETRQAGTWAPAPGSTPAPGQFYASYLYGISCPTPDFCAAVGNIQPESSPSDDYPAAAIFDGTAWTYQQLPAGPAGQGWALTGVSCAAAYQCVAVGKPDGAPDFSANLAEVLNGTTWTPELLPSPTRFPAQTGALTAVSCPVTRWCTAVGWYAADPQGTMQAFTETWDGHAWSPGETVMPGTANRLDGIACPLPGTCTAVGALGSGTGLAEHLASGTWSAQPVPVTKALTGISCLPRRHLCAAAGRSGTSVLAWSHGRWAALTVGGAPVADIAASGVACATARYCVGTGWGNAVPDGTLDGYLMTGPVIR